MACHHRFGLLACLAGSIVACSSPPDPIADVGQEIVGGVDAKSVKLDAVGSLLLDSNGEKKCSARVR